MQVRLQLMYPSMRSPFKSTAQPLRLGRTSSSPTPSMTPMAQLASLIPAAITSRTSLTNSRTSRLRTTPLRKVGRIPPMATSFALGSQKMSPTSVITTQPQTPSLATSLIPIASKTPSPSMLMVATSTLPTTPSSQTATAFASTSSTNTRGFTRGKPSPSPTTNH